jgi:hypothetical protein
MQGFFYGVKVGLDLDKHRNVVMNTLLICFHEDHACKSYLGSIFLPCPTQFVKLLMHHTNQNGLQE